MNLNQLRFVRAVVDAGTFTAAAARCYVTQSTLSEAIASLERELGAPLFARTTRSVALTPFGTQLLPLIDGLLEAETGLRRAAAGLLDPDPAIVRLGVCPLVDTSRLELLLGPYRRDHPAITVVLDQLDGSDARLALDEGRFDFVVRPTGPRRPHHGRALLYEDELVYLGRGAAGAGNLPVRLADIAGDRFVLVRNACRLNTLTRQFFRSRRLPLHEYEGRAASFAVLEEWAAAGIGSAILPRSRLSSPDAGRPILVGNGRRATIRFEALWPHSGDRPPHLAALARRIEAFACESSGLAHGPAPVPG